jgi:long-chain acyl-CoA synthetase
MLIKSGDDAFGGQQVCGIAQTLGNVSLFAAPTIVNRLVAHITQTGARIKGTEAFRTVVYGGGRCTSMT